MTAWMPPLDSYALKTFSMSSLIVMSASKRSILQSVLSASVALAGSASRASLETRSRAAGNELEKLGRRASGRLHSQDGLKAHLSMVTTR